MNNNYTATFIYAIQILLLNLLITNSVLAQTTWTESAAAYDLDLGGDKDGGHGWCDYDLDGDFDLIVNRTSGGSVFYRNNGNSTFTDITNSKASALSLASFERCAVWGDLNNDGFPDFVRNTFVNGIEVYLQHPLTNILGDGIGGFTPQHYNSANIADGVNTEGLGILDYDGDGDLDIIFENDNFGIDILENDGTGNFVHVTAKQAGYNVNDPSTWPKGLVQDAGVNYGAGDYASTTDYNNDGWVDFIARKLDQVDLFKNEGATFGEAIDIDQADNNNKGGVNFSDFDNDGDFDLFWTENGANQIFENDNGNWIPLGNVTGIPTSFGVDRIDGIACGDVDNDGDIDIFLSGDQHGHLFINQQNDPILGANNGNAMEFVESAETFYNWEDGDGCTFVDVDNDGDLDLYVNINGGNNKLFINNLPNPQRQNYIFVDIKEDRAIAGIPNGIERDALGATLRLVDCDGNIISGIREINGGNGHGTQDVARIHFGVPDGPAQSYILQANYPNIEGSERLQINVEITPSNLPNHLYTIRPSEHLNSPPIAQDDDITITTNASITINPLANNGNGLDYDPDGDPIAVVEIITQPNQGTAVLNIDGTITYTPPLNNLVSESIIYRISDDLICSAAGLSSTATININYDSDGDGIVNEIDLDDDNDGIPDDIEGNSSGVLSGNSDLGIGNFHQEIYWFDWSNSDLFNGIQNGDSKTFNLPDGSTITVTFSNVVDLTPGGPSASNYLPHIMETFNGAPAYNYYDFSNGAQIAIYDNSDPVNDISFTVTFTASNDGISFLPDIIFVDAEGTSRAIDGNNDENYYIGTDGDPWEVLETLGTGSFIVSGVGTNNVHIDETENNNSTSLILLSKKTNNLTVEINSEDNTTGKQGFAFGVYLKTLPIDSDNDGSADNLDLDSDNDGIYDLQESGQLNNGATDANNDGIIDGAPATFGNNGLFAAIETDDSSSATVTVTTLDTNNDNIIDAQELDADGDGCSDSNEAYQDNNADGGDGQYGTGDPAATNSLGLVSAASYANPNSSYQNNSLNNICNMDSDGDGISDIVDIDDDNDGIPDSVELMANTTNKINVVLHANTFGQGNRTSSPNTNYIYEPNDWLNDGQSVDNDEYAVLNDLQNAAQWASYAYTSVGDHTGDLNGRMIHFNASFTAGEFYKNPYIHVVENLQVTVNFSVLNVVLSSYAPANIVPNIRVEIRDINGVIIGSPFQTGDIPEDETWHNFSFTFDPLNNSDIQFVLINNAPGGTGNDLAIDDIIFTQDFPDTDNDGIPDYLDLDSDNDGIYDLRESGQLNHGATDIDNNGRIDGAPATFGNNGLFSAIETDDSSSATVTVATLDTDNDNIIDAQELDADGDGCSDSNEAYQDNNADGGDGQYGAGNPAATNSQGLVNAASYANPNNSFVQRSLNNICNPDNDGDGISDIIDIDDDNDGIPDNIEGCGNLIKNPSFEFDDFTDPVSFPNGFTSSSGTFIGTNYNTNTLSGWQYTQNMDGWKQGGTANHAQAFEGSQFIDIIGNLNVSGGVTVPENILFQDINTIIGEEYTVSFYWGDDRAHDIGENVVIYFDVIDEANIHLIDETLTKSADGPINGIIGPNIWQHYENSFIATSNSTRIQFSASPPGNGDNSSGGALDFVNVFRSNNCQDTDSDGISDAFDLDSDNDGIYDIVESGSGAADNNNNGIIDDMEGGNPNDANNDGLSETLETNVPSNEIINYTITDTDNNGLYDFVSLDSDNDNCSDSNEAYGNSNADGGSGQYGAGNPAPTDGNGLVLAANYQEPNDGDTNSTYDFQQESQAIASISTQPSDQLNQNIGDDVSFSVAVNTSGNGTGVTYQWQEFNGSSWANISNGGVYSGATTNTLTLTGIVASMNNYQYRAIVRTPSYVCDNHLTSNAGLLTIIICNITGINCPSDITVGADNGQCSANSVVLGNATMVGTCPGASITNNAPATFPVGVTNVTWTVSGSGGNSATCSQTVTVIDYENPVANCQNVTVSLNGSGTATITPAMVDNGSTDNCNIDTYALSQTTFNATGTYTVTLTVTDDAGNTDTCNSTITVEDNNPPTAVCQDITIQLDASGNASIVATDIDGGSTDNGAIVSYSASQTIFDCSDLGDNNVTLTVTDNGGNSSTCVAVVTVEDNIAPVFNCPADTTLSVDPGMCSASGFNAINNCDNVDLVFCYRTGDTFACIRDANTGQVLSNIIPTAFPTWLNPLPADISNCTDGSTVGQCIGLNCLASLGINEGDDVTFILNYGVCPNDTITTPLINCDNAPSMSQDNCGIASITNDAPAVFPLGNTTVTYIASDASGNTTTCTQIVTVIDDEAPIANCQNVTVSLNGSGTATITPAMVDNGSTDNCNIDTYALSQTTFNATGTYTVTLTVTDDAGNTDTCNSTITVEDNNPPTAVCQDITIQLDAFGNASIVATDIDGGSTDNGVIVSYVASQTSFNCSDVGDVTVTLTVTDDGGNTSSCDATVTVEDNIAPTITCPAAVSVNVDAGQCSTLATNVALGNPTVTDNCGSPTITNDAPAVFPIGTTTVKWTVTDAGGNSASCNQLVTVVDNISPTITSCPGNMTVNVDANSCEATGVLLVNPVATDNCDVPVITNNAPAAFPIGTTTIIWTITDAAGNAVTCSNDVIVIDNIDPTIISCPNDLVVDNDIGMCSASGLSLGTITASDNCLLGSITYDEPTIFPLGNTTVIWTVTDNAGNTSTCSQVVTVVDTENPVANCQDVTVSLDGSGTATITPAMVDNGSTDNCNIDTYALSQTTFNATGTYTVTLTVTDDAGNTDTCSSTITVNDNNPPTAVCQDITIQLDAFGNASIVATDIDGGSTDNGMIVSYVASQTSFDCSDVGDVTVTLTVTDDGGNTSSCEATVTVEDNIAPTITCPAAVSVNVDAGQCSTLATNVALGNPTVTDNCGSPTITNDAPAVFPIGTTTVKWTVTDAGGNSASCNQLVTVVDNISPTITSCPGNMTVNVDANSCEATGVILVNPVVTDNCAVPVITNNAPAAFPVGTTTVTWSVTDAAGNIATCTQDITVIDNINPTITSCPADVVVSNDVGMCSASGVALGLATASDNCTIASVTNNAPAAFPLGNTTVTWIATDNAGNTVTCSQLVTVNDTENPVANCQNVTVSLDDSGTATITPAMVDNGSTDNCNIDTYALSQTTFNATGTYTVTLTVTDDAGNTDTCNSTITVNDNNDPIAVCQDITIQLDASGNASIVATDIDGGSTDNGMIVSYVASQTSFDCSDVGDVTVTLTVTDDGGNTSSCDATVTVEDTIAPVVICQDISLELDDSGNATIDAADIDNGSSDACGINTLSLDISSFDCSNIGVNPVVLTVTDNNGNVAMCNASVTVQDNVTPQAICQNINVQLDASGNANITASDIDNGSYDACGVANLAVDITSFDCSNVGDNPVVLTVTDNNGNVATCNATVSVEDLIAPVVFCQPLTVALDSLGQATIAVSDIDNGSYDACGIDSLYLDTYSFDCSNVGNNPVVLSVTDINGNVASCSTIVTIEDNISPTITCGGDIEQQNDVDACGASITIEIPSTNDNCEVASVINDFNNSEDASGTYPIGTTLITWTVTDSSGNTSQCTQSITVIDTQAPQVLCLDDILVNNDEGVCGALVSFEPPTATDNCSSVTVEQITGPVSGSFFEIDTTLVEFLFTDESGNQSTCSFNVVVIDNEPPVIECQESITQEDPVVFYNIPQFSDNCSAEIQLIDGLASGEEFPHGITTVTYQATDPAGNVSSCSFEVLINLPPVGETDYAEYLEEDNSILIDIIDNDWDPDDDPIMITEAWSNNAFIALQGNQLQYSPIDNWCGTDSITYLVCDVFNACDTAAVIVEVECFIDLIIPEAFSPDGDGVNDYFEILGLEDYPGNNIAIYNRWGHLVFEAEDYQSDWDGKSKSKINLGNQMLPVGTYFFVLDLDSDKVKTIKGYIYIKY